MGTTIARAGRTATAAGWPVAEVLLALATATIHLTMGGLLFTMNAVGYGALAVALVLPGPIGNMRWLARLALLGFTAATIGGWLAFGARFPLAYLDKAIEAGLVAIVAADIWLHDGDPLTIARRLLRLSGQVVRQVAGRI